MIHLIYKCQKSIQRIWRWFKSFFVFQIPEKLDESVPVEIPKWFQDKIKRRRKGKKRRFMGKVGYGASIQDKKALQAYLAGSRGFQYKGRFYRSREKWA